MLRVGWIAGLSVSSSLAGERGDAIMGGQALRFAELFAGAGGLSLGLERAGWACAWHAEWSDGARAVLSHRWPGVPLYGDVTTLDGAALSARHGPIDLLSGGSPCQDLSVAGKRAGLGGARSGLFYEQMRLWDESGADLCLWENVDGARSSNEGRDFGDVLRAFVGVALPVPSDGWRSAGVAAGPRGVAAWRVLDAQFFGVPQRRRRVFVLGTRTGRVDPAEVLSLGEGVRGDSPTRREAGEGTAADAQGGAYGTLRSNWRNNSNPLTEARSLIFDWQNSASMGMECRSESDDSLRTGSVPAVCLTGEVTHALTHEGHDASEDGTGRGTPIVAGTLLSYRRGVPSSDECAQHHVVVANSLRHQTHPTSAGGAEEIMVSAGIPRRLTPLECERLMSWPDGHTLVPDAKGKPLSDAARYKLCGNGVASVQTQWIGWRLGLALEQGVSR